MTINRPQQPQLSDMARVRGSTAKIWKWMQQSQILAQASQAGYKGDKVATDLTMLGLEVSAAITQNKLAGNEKAATAIDNTITAIRTISDKLSSSKERTQQSVGSQCAQELGSYRDHIAKVNTDFQSLKDQYKEIKSIVQNIIHLDAEMLAGKDRQFNEPNLQAQRDQRRTYMNSLREKNAAFQEGAKTYLSARDTLLTNLNKIYQTGFAHMSEADRVGIPEVSTPRAGF